MIEGYRGIRERHFTDLDTGSIDFGIRDQKGRAIGYRWSIRQVNVELMTAEEYAVSVACYLSKDGEPLDYIELYSTPTRDGISYGPITKSIKVDTLEKARQHAVRRTEDARKRNTKKFAAFNKEVA